MGEWHPIKELLSTPINKVLWFSFFYCVCSQFVVVAKKHPPKLLLLSMFRWLTPDWRFPWKQTALNTKGKWPKTRRPANNYSWKQARPQVFQDLAYSMPCDIMSVWFDLDLKKFSPCWEVVTWQEVTSHDGKLSIIYVLTIIIKCSLVISTHSLLGTKAVKPELKLH